MKPKNIITSTLPQFKNKQKNKAMTTELKTEIKEELFEANQHISDARSLLNKIANKILKKEPHVFKPDANVFATIEEDNERLKVVSVNKDEVTFDDGTSLDLNDLGTDDFYSVIDMVVTETFGEK